MKALFWVGEIALSIWLAFFIGKKIGNSNLSKKMGTSVALFWLVWTLGASAFFMGGLVCAQGK